MRSEITGRSRLPSPRFPRVLRSLGPPLEAACAEPVPTSRRAAAPDTVGWAIRMTSPRTTEPPGSSGSLDPESAIILSGTTGIRPTPVTDSGTAHGCGRVFPPPGDNLASRRQGGAVPTRVLPSARGRTCAVASRHRPPPLSALVTSEPVRPSATRRNVGRWCRSWPGKTSRGVPPHPRRASRLGITRGARADTVRCEPERQRIPAPCVSLRSCARSRSSRRQGRGAARG